MFKKIIIVLLSILSIYFLYQTLGYIVLGSQSPVLYNGEYSYFMGMYLMAITYGAGFLISIGIILALVFVKKQNKIKN